MDLTPKMRTFVIVFAIPLYFFTMIGERYEAMGYSSTYPFTWLGKSAEFWGEWLYVLTKNHDWYDKGHQRHKRNRVLKVRKHTRRKIVKRALPEVTLSMYDRLSPIVKDSGLWFRPDFNTSGGTVLDIRDGYGLSWGSTNFNFVYRDDQWWFTKYDENGVRKFMLEADQPIGDVYESEGSYTEKPVTLNEMAMVLEQFMSKDSHSWQV